MPSPIAHVAVAIAAAVSAPAGSPLRARRALAAAVVASLAPDGDLLLALLLPGGVAWHHGPTHSLIGALLLGFLVARGFGLRGVPALWTVLAAMSHPVLDWELGVPSESARFGVPLFWPGLPDKLISPWPIFLPFAIHQSGFLANMFTRAAVEPYLRELVFAAIVLGYVRLTRGIRLFRPRPR